MSQLQGKNKTLFPKVLLNELILANIFSNFEPNQYLSFRLVCKLWKSRIDSKLSKELVVTLHKPGQTTFTEKEYMDFTKEGINYMKLLNISKINLTPNPMIDFDVEKELQDSSVLLILKETGANLKNLKLFRSSNRGKEFVLLKNILTLAPNLEILETNLKLNGSQFCKAFADFRNLKLKRLWFQHDVECVKSLVDQLLKCFPNLETNFGSDILDCHLMEMIRDNKSQIKLRSYEHSARKGEQRLQILSELSAKIPLAEIKIGAFRGWDQNLANLITKIVQNFAKTLTNVNLLCGLFIGIRESFTISLPKLPALRKLCLGVSSVDGCKPFYWKLGKSMANDFPLLEYLILKPGFADSRYSKYCGEHEISDSIKEAWKFWNPFLPILDEDSDADLSPLRSLKYVDLAIPKEWVGPEENLKWGKRFLEAYLKLYGNAGKGNVQNIIDWGISSDNFNCDILIGVFLLNCPNVLWAINSNN